MENMIIISSMELKVPMYGRSFESTLFLASHDVDVIRPELCCVLWTWGLLQYFNLYAK
jgi:hypothetical protein